MLLSSFYLLFKFAGIYLKLTPGIFLDILLDFTAILFFQILKSKNLIEENYHKRQLRATLIKITSKTRLINKSAM